MRPTICHHVYPDGHLCERVVPPGYHRCITHQKHYRVIGGVSVRPPKKPPSREVLEARAQRKRIARDRAKARRLGLASVPGWIFNKHPEACSCYDCLWGDPSHRWGVPPAEWVEIEPTPHRVSLRVG